jgi:serine/threonine-protein kinase
MYWLVTGHQVFTTDSPMGTIAEHITSKPTLPSLRAETEIPPELDRLILDCLEKKPTKRPQTVADLAERLSGMPLNDWNSTMAREWWQSHLPEQVAGSALRSGETPLEVVRIAR